MAAGLYLAAGAAMYFLQRTFIYFPDPQRMAPADAGLADVSERTIETADGEKIIVWYAPAKPGQPTLLYFHGNGGALETRRDRIRKYMNRGRGIFMMSYRGYSGSTGTPTEAANVADAKLAYQALVKEGVQPDDIILYGESLGSGVAVQVARENPAQGLILDSPYTSLADIGAQVYWWLPVRWLMSDTYDSRRYIADLKLPLFILHGAEDEVVPAAMGQELYERANAPKEIAVLPGAGHNDHWQFGSFDKINDWIDRLRAGRLAR
jgi:fermentation-respiration switch protein FrsA (DUF1100 family)